MKYYKLTDKNDQTRGGCQWDEGVKHTAPGKGELCTEAYIHVYTDPLLAILFNKIHACFDLATAHMWECRCGGETKTDGLKVGVTRCKTIKRIPLPPITTEQRVRFAIFCAWEVCQEKNFITWAEKWLSGEDRAEKTAEMAAKAIWSTIKEEGIQAARAAAWEASGVIWKGRYVSKAMECAALCTTKVKKLDFIALANRAVKEEGN